MGQQVKTQRCAQQALSLAVEHRHVFVALGRRGQLAGRIQLTDNKRGTAQARHLLFKLPALLAKYPRRPGIGTGAQQQGLGETVELIAGHIIGIDEEPPQAVQALLLVFEALLQTRIPFVDQQLKALAHLLLIEIGSRPGDDCGQREPCQ